MQQGRGQCRFIARQPRHSVRECHRCTRRVYACSVPEEVLLDENVEARKHDYYDVHDVSVTDDGRVVAFSEDCVGSELYSVRIVDTATRRPLLPAGPTKTTGQVEWAADNSTFFYVAQDQKQRPYQVRDLVECMGRRREATADTGSRLCVW